MSLKEPKNISSLLSVGIHLALIIIFMLWNINMETPTDEFVTLGFGTFGNISSSGAVSKNADKKNNPKVKKKTETKKAKKEVKKVELPKIKNEYTENIITAAKRKKKDKDEKPQKIKPVVKPKTESKGKLNSGEGEGSFGFEIDFGGKGKRKIYSYSLPSYPEGVSKEIDVKLKFSIMPDGTVGRVFPLIKADARLENAAMNSLRQWRFEPLPNGQKQKEQTAVIVFPYRLQ